MQESETTYEQDGAVAVVTLNRPDKSNALSKAMRASLQGRLERAGADDSVRCVLVLANGASFCGGLDLGDLPESSIEWRERVMAAQRNQLTIVRMPKPVVVAAQGAIVGGGASLALSADVLVLAEDAYFAFPFIRLGIVPDGGSSHFLQAKLGVALATDLLLTAGRLKAQEAVDRGLTRRLIPTAELQQAAMTLARQLAEGPSEARSLTKQLCQGFWTGDLEETMRREAELFIEAVESPGHRTAVEALKAKARGAAPTR